MATQIISETESRTTDIELQPQAQQDAVQHIPESDERQHIWNNAVPPDTAVDALQRWNYPRLNLYKVMATFWSFFIFGMNDGAYGALIPHLETYYHLDYTVVSLIFLSPFAGYTLASTLSNSVHVSLGQRGIAVLGPLCHLLSYIILLWHPPYPVLVVVFIVVGFGNGLIDAAWCAWIGNMANGNQVSGCLQASYSAGATISPLIVTGLIENASRGWWSFYYLMAAVSAVELLTSASTFWAQTGAVYLQENPRDPSSSTGRTRQALKSKITWLFAIFIFGYQGAEGSLGGWVVSFMKSARNATPLTAATTSTAFWAGMTIGRVLLSFLSARLGEFYSIALYIILSISLELIFWLVPNLVVSAVAVSLLGFCLGPIFATGIVYMIKLLPKDLHVGAIAFATTLGGSGGAIFPFVVGAIAQVGGVKLLQPVVLGLLVVVGGLWMLLPKGGKRDEEVREEIRGEVLS